MKTITRHFLRSLLILLFVGYYANISFFWHKHIVEGEAVVLSHICLHSSSCKDQTAKHNHNKKETQLIKQLSCFISTASNPQPILDELLPSYTDSHPVQPTADVFGTYFSTKQLRAPPVC